MTHAKGQTSTAERGIFTDLSPINNLVPRIVDLVRRHLQDDIYLQSPLKHRRLLKTMISIYFVMAGKKVQAKSICSQALQLVREKKKSKIRNQLAF